MRHLALFCVLRLILVGLGTVGCETTFGSPAPPRSVSIVEVTGEPEFFCQMDFVDVFFQHLAADHAAGNRRSADAWALLDNAKPAVAPPGQERLCWQGAIFYLGVFAPRAELPRLIQLATHDPMVDVETTDAELIAGISDLGESRSSAHGAYLYLALAAQVRRQVMFDRRLDAEGEQALRLVEVCALDDAFCMPATPMHRARRERLRRNAMRGLGITGASSSTRVLAAIASTPPSDEDYLLPYAYQYTLDIMAGIDARQHWLRWQVPRP